MIANQKLIASDGKEVMLFPLEYINISQGENGQYSHQGTLNIDFLGYFEYNIYCRCFFIIEVFRRSI